MKDPGSLLIFQSIHKTIEKNKKLINFVLKLKIKKKKKTWNGLGILSQNITLNILSYLRQIKSIIQKR